MTSQKTSNKIPILDLNAQYQALRGEILEAVEKVFDSQYFILGPEVEGLEKELEEFLSCSHALGISSGTDALLVALMALGVGPGDEVVTTPFSFFATVGSIVRLGAKPVFVDIRDSDYNLDPSLLKEALTEKTKAILPVHLYGQCAEMETILDLAGDIPVVEDAAQAIGATRKGESAGSMGAVGCFSFYPSKNLGGVGEGGLCTTNSEELAHTIKLLRNHGITGPYKHDLLGGNFRLGAINAAVLRIKLRHLAQWNEQRRHNAGLYNQYFAESGLVESGQITLPEVLEGNTHIYHQYVIRTKKRDQLQQYLASQDIHTVVYYPIPLHLQPCLTEFGYEKGDLPVAEKMADQVLALPIYPELKEEQIQRVVAEIKAFFDGQSEGSKSP